MELHRSRVVLIILALVSVSCKGHGAGRNPPSATPDVQRVTARPPTSAEAFDQLWETLVDMPFFREHGYAVGLPQDEVFQRLAMEGIPVQGEAQASLQRYFDDKVYDPREFDSAMEVLSSALPIVNEAVKRMQAWTGWGFRLFDRYEVVLTVYGPGGSYNSSTGRVTLFTDRAGQGRFNKPFAHTIVHEIVHIGIQKGVVEAKGLSHPDKERLVDRICHLAFPDLLSGYRMQRMGDPTMDESITETSLRDLPAAVDRFLSERGNHQLAP